MRIVGGRNEYSFSEMWLRTTEDAEPWDTVQRIGPFTSPAQLGPVAVRELRSLGSVYIDVGDSLVGSAIA